MHSPARSLRTPAGPPAPLGGDFEVEEAIPQRAPAVAAATITIHGRGGHAGSRACRRVLQGLLALLGWLGHYAAAGSKLCLPTAHGMLMREGTLFRTVNTVLVQYHSRPGTHPHRPRHAGAIAVARRHLLDPACRSQSPSAVPRTPPAWTPALLRSPSPRRGSAAEAPSSCTQIGARGRPPGTRQHGPEQGSTF